MSFASVVIVSAAVLFATAGSALAQPGGGGGRGGFGGGRGDMMPAINSRQVDSYAKILGMTKDQKDAATALLEGYSQQAALASKTMRDQSDKIRQEFQDSGDPTVWSKMRDGMTKFRDDRKKLDDGFMNDVKALLTPAQAEKWPQVERATRRDQTLRWGRLSGERVDLVQLVDQQKFPAAIASQVTPVLAQYEEELDGVLVKRNEVYEGAMQKMMELMRSGDTEAAQDIVKKGREAGIRVRDVNRKYARQIEDILPEDQKAGFEFAFRKESFPDAYRKPYSQRAIEAAAAMKDLTPEQKEKISQMSASVTKDMDALAAKIATATEETEMNFDITQMMRGGGRQEGPMADLRKDRRDLDRKSLEALKKVLTEEQAAKLPERSEDENADGGPPGGGRRGPNGGNGGQQRNRG